jgi:hypothetical protein
LYDLTSGFFHLERARHIEILHTGIKRYNKFAFHSYITVYGGLRSESLLLFKITCDEFLQVFVIRAFKLRIFRLFKLTRVEQTLVIIDSFRKRLRSTVHAFTDCKQIVYVKRLQIKSDDDFCELFIYKIFKTKTMIRKQ